jgi:heme O synthase-like polyprenyltransferase
MWLAVFTGLVGLIIAPSHLSPALVCIAIISIATGWRV